MIQIPKAALRFRMPVGLVPAKKPEDAIVAPAAKAAAQLSPAELRKQSRKTAELNAGRLNFHRDAQDLFDATQDWRHEPDEFDARLKEIGGRYLPSITDASAAEQFRGEIEQMSRDYGTRNRSRSTQGAIDDQYKTLSDAQAFYAGLARNAGNDADRDAARSHFEKLVLEALDGHLITDRQAETWLGKFASSTAPALTKDTHSIDQALIRDDVDMLTATPLGIAARPGEASEVEEDDSIGASKDRGVPRSRDQRDAVERAFKLLGVTAEAADEPSSAQGTYELPKYELDGFDWTNTGPTQADLDTLIKSDSTPEAKVARGERLKASAQRKELFKKIEANEISVPPILKNVIAEFFDKHPTGDFNEPEHESHPHGEKHEVTTAWRNWAVHRTYWRVRDEGYTDAVARSVVLNLFRESEVNFSFNQNREISRGPFQIKIRQPFQDILDGKVRREENTAVPKTLGDSAVLANLIKDNGDRDRLLYDLDLNLDILAFGLNAVRHQLNEADSMEFAMYMLVAHVFNPETVATGSRRPDDPIWRQAVIDEIQLRMAGPDRDSRLRRFMARLPKSTAEKPTGWSDAAPLRRKDGTVEDFNGSL